MKVSTASAAVLAFASSAVAQTIESKPFNLILQSSDSNYNGHSLTSCHEGAGIEGLCIGPKPGQKGVTLDQFFLNTTQGSTEQIKGKGVLGTLVWVLHGGNFVESEPMALSVDPSSNVAIPLFSPSYDNTPVAFDKQGLMNIQSFINDQTNPPSTTPAAYYRWYICKTYYGYPYTTLSWTLGSAKPENPTCVKTDVKQVFVK